MSVPSHITALISLLREERNLEFKESRPWSELKEKIARTAMGMANTRDGGTIIVGVKKIKSTHVAKGISKKDLATYDPDDIQAFINKFADPYVQVEVHIEEFEKKRFLAIVVREFDEIPVVCRKSSGPVLQQGAIYTRGRRIPETCEVQTQTEMREIIEMAVEKGLLRYVQAAARAHVTFVPSKTDEEKYETQRKRKPE